MKVFNGKSIILILGVLALFVFLTPTYTAEAMSEQTKKAFDSLGKAWAGSSCKGKSGQDKNDCCADKGQGCMDRCDQAFEQGDHVTSGLDDCKQGCGNVARKSCMAAAPPDESGSITSIIDMEESRLIKWSIIDAGIHEPPAQEVEQEQQQQEKN